MTEMKILVDFDKQLDWKVQKDQETGLDTYNLIIQTRFNKSTGDFSSVLGYW
jgi:hypothetical protein